MYDHLLSSSAISSLTEISNVLAFCKSMSKEFLDDHINKIMLVKVALNALQQYLDTASTLEDPNISFGLIQFLLEQLKLVAVDKGARRYSSDLITIAFLWKLTSTSLYTKLSNFFVLPSIRRLQQLSCSDHVETNVIDIQYLKQRTATFTEGEKAVTLLFDKLYTAQSVEYQNGTFVGLTEDGERARTVLTFMVQSVCKSYKDVVCLVPVEKLDTSKVHFWFDKGMKSPMKYFLWLLFLLIIISARG